MDSLTLACLGIVLYFHSSGATSNGLEDFWVVGVGQRFNLLLLVKLVNQIEYLVLVLDGQVVQRTKVKEVLVLRTLDLVELRVIQNLFILHVYLLMINCYHVVIILAVDLVLLLCHILTVDLVLRNYLLRLLLDLVLLHMLLTEQHLLGNLRGTWRFVWFNLVLGLVPLFLIQEQERLRQVDVLVDINVLLSLLQSGSIVSVVVSLLPVCWFLVVSQQLRSHIGCG